MITQNFARGGEGSAIRLSLLSKVLVVLRLALIGILIAVVFIGYRAWRASQVLSDSDAALVDGKRVGIVAGHWQNDSGAVCPDGLQEVQVTLDIAQRVVKMLRQKGYRAELWGEFSDQLSGYEADALVSIHVDSCLKDRSGFKVARLTYSAVPEEEDRLVECLYKEYEKSTGLPRDEATITEDMKQYHVFRKIAPQTPGAIIEVGFLGGDRKLLTRQPTRVAQGIVAGIVCFLEHSNPGGERELK